MTNLGRQRTRTTTVSTRTGEQKISETVLAAVADYKGTDVFELDPPLYDALDPDALDSLFRGSQGSVRFDYWGCTVTVSHDGVVTVTGEGDNQHRDRRQP